MANGYANGGWIIATKQTNKQANKQKTNKRLYKIAYGSGINSSPHCWCDQPAMLYTCGTYLLKNITIDIL